MYYNQYSYYPQPQPQQYMDQLSQLRTQQPQQPPMQPPMQSQPQNSITWVQGEEGAKAYLVAAGNSVWLMDSEAPVFYIKSTDASGVPMPLRIFDFHERGGQPRQTEAPTADYARREDMDRLSAQFAELNERYTRLNEQYITLARELGIQSGAEVVHNG